MCHLWEPMRHWYRPLAFYIFMEIAAWLCHVGELERAMLVQLKTVSNEWSCCPTPSSPSGAAVGWPSRPVGWEEAVVSCSELNVPKLKHIFNAALAKAAAVKQEGGSGVAAASQLPMAPPPGHR
jgi:hypothetical protein